MWYLVIVWVGVGVGEVGVFLICYLFIVDYFLLEYCVMVIFVYVMGVLIGVMLGFIIGGYVVEVFGWWIVFFVVGFFGIFLVGVIYLIVCELFRGLLEGGVDIGEVFIVWEVLSYFW